MSRTITPPRLLVSGLRRPMYVSAPISAAVWVRPAGPLYSLFRGGSPKPRHTLLGVTGETDGRALASGNGAKVLGVGLEIRGAGDEMFGVGDEILGAGACTRGVGVLNRDPLGAVYRGVGEALGDAERVL